MIFLAADYDVVSRLKEQGRIFLAWQSIVADIESGTLNQDLTHLTQAKRNREGAEQSLTQLIRETYKWLISPIEEFVKGKPTLNWEVVSVSPTAPNLVQAIEEKLREEEWLIYEWSPIHLRNVLNQWYLKDGVEDVCVLKVWQDTCHYLYLPRLVNDTVFRSAVNQGVESEDYFAFASGKEGDRYLGFTFGRSSISTSDESSLLIDREAALVYRETIQQKLQPTPEPSGNPGDGTPSGETGGTVAPTPTPGVPGYVGTTTSSGTKKQFYGTISLNPVKAKMDFATIMDEVVQQFTAKLGVDVMISVEIEAKCNDGFDEGLQRTVKENCNVLRFSNAEFETDE